MSWFNNSWQYRKPLNTNSTLIPSGQSEFPTLLHVTDASLQAKAQNNGDDIVFTGSVGTSQLDHEIENYNSATGELWTWVKIPSLNPGGQSIFMYYGNSGAANQENTSSVWSANYNLVQHMDESSGQAIDSSPNGLDSTDNDPESYGAGGQVSDGYRYSGASFTTFNSSPISGATAMTMTAWVNSDAEPVDNAIMGDRQGTTSDAANGIRYDEAGFSGNQSEVIKLGVFDGAEHTAETASNTQTTSQQLLALTWQQPESPDLYIDADPASYSSSPTSVTGSLSSNSFFIAAGQKDGGASYWDGVIDEVRVATRHHTQDWFETRYEMETAPGTGAGSFWTIGSESEVDLTVTDTTQLQEFRFTSDGVEEVSSGDNNSVSFIASASVPTGARVAVLMNENIGGTGGVDNAQVFDLQDGKNTYSVSGFDASQGNEYYPTIRFRRQGAAGQLSVDTIAASPTAANIITDNTVKEDFLFTPGTAVPTTILKDNTVKEDFLFTPGTADLSGTGTISAVKENFIFSEGTATPFATVTDTVQAEQFLFTPFVQERAIAIEQTQAEQFIFDPKISPTTLHATDATVKQNFIFDPKIAVAVGANIVTDLTQKTDMVFTPFTADLSGIGTVGTVTEQFVFSEGTAQQTAIVRDTAQPQEFIFTEGTAQITAIARDTVQLQSFIFTPATAQPRAIVTDTVQKESFVFTPSEANILITARFSFTGRNNVSFTTRPYNQVKDIGRNRNIVKDLSNDSNKMGDTN